MSYRSKSSIQRTYARKSILFWHSQWDGINRVVTSTFTVSTGFSKIHWPRQGRFRPFRQHRHTKPHVTSVPIYAPLSVSAITGVTDSRATRDSDFGERPTRRPISLLRCEVAGNVQHKLRQARCICVNPAIDARHNRHVGGNRSVNRVQRRNHRLLLSVWP